MGPTTGAPVAAETETVTGAPLLHMANVHVAFGGNVALADVAFEIRPGEIVGLLGHNGAGKSTLVNVATGALRPQRGTMEVKGQPVPLRGNPRDMERAGIKVIHQEPRALGHPFGRGQHHARPTGRRLSPESDGASRGRRWRFWDRR